MVMVETNCPENHVKPAKNFRICQYMGAGVVGENTYTLTSRSEAKVVALVAIRKIK